ncbi:MAG TPA: glycoside hydrolase family 88 protein, partial [Polyangiaceae bacterium]
MNFSCAAAASQTVAPPARRVPVAAAEARPASIEPAPIAVASNPLNEAAADAIAVSVQNALAIARPAETIALELSELVKLLPSLQTAKLVVLDAAGKQRLSQLVDTDGDELADELVFQSDLGKNETQSFSVGEGKRLLPAQSDFKVYGRFVRERHDDFAWENDRVAHRVYGPALETWEKEPLTSSGIDVWCKRTERLVVNDWYQRDDYHHDNGEGADFYSVGRSRGCGGVGVWEKGKLAVSKNFSASRVLANGPIRLIFELSYAPWQTAGGKVSEVKRVTVDRGSHFDRYQSSFKVERAVHGQRLSIAIGVAKHEGASLENDAAAHLVRSWEPIKGDSGHIGCTVIDAPDAQDTFADSETDRLIVSTLPADQASATYLAGAGWDKGGDVADAAAWAALSADAAQRLQSPLRVTLALKSHAPRHGAALPWPERTASALMTERPAGLTDKWEYDSGLELKGFLAIWEKTHDPAYFEYVKRTVDGLLDAEGNIKGYRPEDYNLDAINMGKVLFSLYAQAQTPADKQRYQHALAALRAQLKAQPRTRDGGFWHKAKYPHQMWLDGIYMASPFLAEYGLTFAEPADLDEVARQILLAERHLRDPKSGLLYHGWDESKSERWANPKTGTSSQFWGRALGWYAMAVVDVLELLPKNHPQRAPVQAVLERLAAAIASVQDAESGVFWQVLDAPKRAKNYKESSASAMFAYALAKAVRLGLIDRKRYAPVAERAARGLLTEFVATDE